jgi:hypothetical protein
MGPHPEPTVANLNRSNISIDKGLDERVPGSGSGVSGLNWGIKKWGLSPPEEPPLVAE